MNRLALAHGAFYVATGVWPIIHERSFEAVTGPKVDRWLVRTTGALIAAVGASLIAAATERRTARATAILGAASGLALGGADVVYASRRRISRIYLLDAAIELALAAGWLCRIVPTERPGHVPGL